MTIYETKVLDPWAGEREKVGQLSTEEERPLAPNVDLFDVLVEILGYDIREADLMAEGYREAATDALDLAEGSLGASFDTLPPE